MVEGEREEGGEGGWSDSTGKFRPPGPTRVRPPLNITSAAPPDQDGNVRCPELDARTRRR